MSFKAPNNSKTSDNSRISDINAKIMSKRKKQKERNQIKEQKINQYNENFRYLLCSVRPKEQTNTVRDNSFRIVFRSREYSDARPCGCTNNHVCHIIAEVKNPDKGKWKLFRECFFGDSKQKSYDQPRMIDSKHHLKRLVNKYNMN